jgi:hypothetical protein
MSVTTQSVPPVAEGSVTVPGDLIWRLSVDQYHAMIRTGILTDEDPDAPMTRLGFKIRLQPSWRNVRESWLKLLDI